MAGIIQAPQLVSASRENRFEGGGKTQLPDFSGSWDGAFGMGAASAQGRASNWNSDNQFAATIWSPSEYGATTREGLSATGNVGATGLNAYGQTKQAKIQADAMQKRQGGDVWGQLLGGAFQVGAALAMPAPKFIMPKA
jgi:hypothetical protein